MLVIGIITIMGIMNPHKKGILCLLMLAFSLLQVLSSCTNMISVNFALFTNTPLAFPCFHTLFASLDLENWKSAMPAAYDLFAGTST